MEHFRLRRSLLFVPGDRPDRIKKSITLDTDVVVIDLEDAVAPEQKAAARQSVKQALEEVEFGQKECVVRINSILTLNGIRDLAAFKDFGRHPDTVIAPKVESAEEVQILGSLLEEINPAIGIIVVLESAKGILAAREIAMASPKVNGVIFGGGDLSGDIGCPMTWEPLLGARQLVVLAAAAAKVDAIDVPFLDLEDMHGLEEETRRIASMGYAGKAVIHPKQIETVNRIFSPGESDVAWARRVLEAVKQSGQGAIRVDGKMVDAAVVKRAEKIAQTARRVGSV
ncbi:hypothetical protein SY88_15480 [Clostridiales bacterium PH28_bin88]|nr:hypothetical protein SY88_15480 [Clostridiales bacterium PH28_bin88]